MNTTREIAGKVAAELRAMTEGRDPGRDPMAVLRDALTFVQPAMNRPEAFNVTIPFDAWEHIGDEEHGTDSRLLSTATINGHFFHVEAIAVSERGEHGIRHAVDPQLDSNIDAACEINGCSCEPQRIGERDYVITCIPFED